MVAGNPVITGTTISSTWANNTLSDITANGLTNCLTKDGQQTPTNNIPMGNFRITGLGAGTARTDAAQVGQVQDGALTLLSSVSGSNTITANTSPVFTAYATGQEFSFVAAANNTGAVTLNINSIGAKAITRNGTDPLAQGDIFSGAMVSVLFDGTQFQLQNTPTTGRFLGVQVFLGNATYTPTSGMKTVIFEVQGGGASGGGATLPSSGNVSCGAPGTSGAYAKGIFSSASVGASQAITVGAGASGQTGGGGLAGGTSSVGALISANGGVAGSMLNNVGAGALNGNGNFQNTVSGANILTCPGGAENVSIATTTVFGFGGSGGRSLFGVGGVPVAYNSVGGAGIGYGSGGSGVVANQFLPGSIAGGAGKSGIVLAWEYA